ncbi:myomegalin isoform X1 [Pygocentrus nattereri]|uniref:myomegalin isoform X1 n=1 Tax=Pygocentrus nattereri TaxID=42514 RepID=UPI00081435C5|nr:myomegalin isoform X1 [Pygocentrus nattereri]
MLDSKTKELCRICARELYGNQRRWIFHPAAKLSLQVLLSHALGKELTRDGRGEFACSKCAFMLDRMYRFDTVIARVEALSIERMQKLLLEKERLRQCIGGLYRKNNADDFGAGLAGDTAEASVVDISGLSDSKYSSLIEDDLMYSVYESWAEHEALAHHQQAIHHHHQCHAGSESSSAQRSRKCRGCAALRVADSDYEAVCKVPRKVGRSTSCGPSTRYSASVLGSTEVACPDPAPMLLEPDTQSSSLTEVTESAQACEAEHSSISPATSVESLDTAVDVSQPCPAVHAELVQGDMDEEKVMIQRPEKEQSVRTGCGGGLELALSLVKSFECRPVQVPRGSRLPVPVKPFATLPERPLSLLQVPQAGTDCTFSPQTIDMVSSSIQQELQLELSEMEELWLDDYVQCRPLGVQKKLIGEQQAQLVQYESAAGECVSELQKAQLQVQSLQTKIRESEVSNKKLQQRLKEMECELRSVREAAHGQERTIQTLSDSLNTKDIEVADLQQLIEEQKELLCSRQQQNQQHQLQQLHMSGAAPGQLQAELLELQASQFSSELELQHIQKSQRQAQRREDDLTRSNQRLLTDLQGALHQHQETEKHNQELLAALQKARSDLEQMEEKWKEGVREKEREVEECERSIRKLRSSLQHKEHLLQDYSELLDGQKETGGNRDILIHKLKQRIQERDRALEHSVDERFVCVEQKEDEIHKLQLLLREKQRDMEKLRCVLSSNEETITSLEALLRGKALELEQVNEAWRCSKQDQHESEETHTRSLRERDTLITQLQAALHTCTKEAEEMTAALLSKLPLGSTEVMEELRRQLQLKERLFQGLLADCSWQAQEHHAHVQELLGIINARDQYIKDSSERMGQMMSEQVARLQELRRQVLSAGNASQSTSNHTVDTQSLQEELRLVLAREKDAQSEMSALRSSLAINQNQIQTQASEMEALNRTICIKDEIIKDLQMQLVESSDLPLVEKLTQELQELRERDLLQEPSCPNHKGNMDLLASMETEPTATSQADTGDFTTEEEEEDCNSEFADSTEEDENCRLTAQALAVMQAYEQHVGPAARPLSQDAAVMEGQGLAEVKLLVEQKRAVERELWELKAQLEKAGFSSFSQMRKALFSLRSENEELRSLARERESEESGRGASGEGERQLEKPSEEPSDPTGKACTPRAQVLKGDKKPSRPLSLDLQPLLSHSLQVESVSGEVPLSSVEAGLSGCTVRLKLDLEQMQQESRDLQERLMVSEATVQAQAEQLKDYRELLTETSVQQDSKQVQVDLQDLGYETCGRSENEAERDDTSSPEFDDLELCTSLSYRDGASQWWSGAASTGRAEGDVVFLQQLVEDLRGQLSRSQAQVRSLQTRTGDATPTSTPRKVNWGLESGAEEDEGWQSSDGCGSLPRRPRPDTELQELVARVSSLEEQLRKGKGQTEEAKSSTWPGKFDALIQAQARELSHLRQRMREGRGVCHILTQHLGDTTKTFEELLRANDIDYYMGQSFREQLTQSSSLAQRVAAKISSRDHSELPEDKTGHELLAIRLSKELQQKDKLIESLRSKLDQQQSRPDTPTSSHALSEATDQSEHTSFISDEQGSTNEDLELCSELDAASEFGQVEASERSTAGSHCKQGPAPSHTAISSSLTSSHGHQSTNSCPSMHCSPHRPVHGGFSGAQVKPLSSYPLGTNLQTDPSSFHRLSQQAFHQSPLASLNASPTLKSGAGLLESSVLWDMTYGSQPMRDGAYGDVSSGSSGYQSGARHKGTDLMEEHLREIRSLRQRLEDSIHTNDRLRQQLEDRLASMARDGGGAPTNIYIQGLDSVSQLSNEVRLLKEDNHALQSQLQQARRDSMKEVEQLREAVLSGRGRLTQAELETERWAEQCRRLQVQMQEQAQATLLLKQERQSIQENANRLQHEVNVLQQQLSESRQLVHTLQCELQGYQRMCGPSKSLGTGSGQSLAFDLKEPQSHLCMLEQQLSDGLDPNLSHSSVRKQLFHDPSPSPPVRDMGLFSPASPVSAEPDDLHPSVSDSAKPCTGSSRESEVLDGSFACKTGRHIVGHVDDFIALQQQLLEAKLFIRKMEAALQSSTEIDLQEGCVKNLLTNTKTLKQILEATSSVLKMFWRAALPRADANTQQLQKEQSLREEVFSLRRKLSEQEQALRDSMETLRSSNRTKDSMEQFIVNQLSRTRDVLKKARTNLEKNELRISSLSCSFSPPSPQSFSCTPPWAVRGEVPATVWSSSRGGSIMTCPAQGHNQALSVPLATQCFGTQRPLDVFCNNALSGFSTAVSPLC